MSTAAMLGVLCAAPLIVSGCAQPNANAAKSDELPVVATANPIRQSIVEWDEYIGRLNAVETVEVRARVSGYLSRTCIDEGLFVEAGTVLAVIDQRPFQAEVDRNQALVTASKSQLVQAHAAETQANSEMKRVEIRRDLAQKLMNRSQQLRQGNATTAEDLEVREAELAAAESEVLVAEARIASAKAAVEAAESAVGVAEANLDLAKIDLKDTEVLAPISGRLSNRFVTEGNFVSGGSDDATLLTTIVAVDEMHCYFDVDEQSYLKYISLGRGGAKADSMETRVPVYLSLANEPNSFPHQGYMDFVDNRLDFDTGTMRTRAILSNKKQMLAPGLFARVRIPGSTRYDAILVPDRAVGTDQAEKFVLIVDADGTVQRRQVTLGPISHGLRVIREGLTGEEQLILTGQVRVRPGHKVQPEAGTIEAAPEILSDIYAADPENEPLIQPRPSAANARSLPPSGGNRSTMLLSQTADETGGSQIKDNGGAPESSQGEEASTASRAGDETSASNEVRLP